MVGFVLSAVALFQGLRPPVVQKYAVALPGLPPALDGLRLVALSDMHLGVQPGADRLRARIAQVNALQPDVVSTVLAGLPDGATVLLSHTPWYAEKALKKGSEAG